MRRSGTGRDDPRATLRRRCWLDTFGRDSNAAADYRHTGNSGGDWSSGGDAVMSFAFITSGTSWSGVATDGSNITVEAVGGGGGGVKSTAGAANVAVGGGGGAYATKTEAYTSSST